MKKTIYTSLLSLTMLVANAQTKEETISWLNQKLKNYLVFDNNKSDIKEITLTECDLQIKVSYISYGESKTVYFTIPVDTTIQVSSSGFEFNAKKIKVYYLLYGPGSGSEDFINWTSGRDLAYKLGDRNTLTIKEGEENILPRLQKALRHLATFCTEKPKETF